MMRILLSFHFVLTLLAGVLISAPFLQAHAQDTIPAPDSSVLDTADDVVFSDSQEVTAAEDTSPAIDAPSVSGASPDIFSDDFFDAQDVVPSGEMRQASPIKVQPSKEPASRLVIVTKNTGADKQSARLVSAERALNLGRYGAALRLFDDLYQANNNDERVLMGRAVALQKLERFDEAVRVYETLSKLRPHDVDVKLNMFGLLATRYPAVAIRHLNELYADNQSHVGVISQLGIAHANAGDVRTGLEYLEMAASIDPHNAMHVFNMAIIADRGNETQDALSYYEQALDIDTIHGGGRSVPRETIYNRIAQIR